jgi:hypothetical protein
VTQRGRTASHVHMLSPPQPPRYSSRSAPHLLLVANIVLNVALVHLPRPPLRKSVMRALSLNPPTPPRRLHRSTPRPLQNESPQTGCLQHDHSPSRLPLTKENLRAFEPVLSLAEEASPVSTPRNPSPTRKESAWTHMKRLAGYNITIDTISRCACAIREKHLGYLVRRRHHHMHKQ